MVLAEEETEPCATNGLLGKEFEYRVTPARLGGHARHQVSTSWDTVFDLRLPVGESDFRAESKVLQYR